MIIARVKKPLEADVSIRPELIVPWWEIMAVAVPMLGVGIVLSAYFDLTRPAGAFYLLITDRFFLLNGAFWAVAEFSYFMRTYVLGPTPYAFLADLFIPQHKITPPNGIHLAAITMVAGLVINAFYEEIVYMGYGFNLWAAKYGPRTAVLFSILARLAIHTYQGTEHLFYIAAWATLYGIWYRYHRNLWHLIFAHFMIDLITFTLLKHAYPPT